jgi:hypothetical protein
MASAQVYKCTVNGSLSFQDRPCTQGKQQQVTIKRSSGGDVSAPTRRVSSPFVTTPSASGRDDDKYKRARKEAVSQAKEHILQDTFDKMARRNKVGIGMTEKQAERAWGRPTKINRSSHGADQWVYQREGAAGQYLYFKNGLLTAWN